jgi:hypothetical protein
MTKPNKAAAFIENLKLAEQAPRPPSQPKPRNPKPKKPPPTRAGLKHIGGYFDMDTIEKVAILRARLRLDNSQLIKLAVEELHSKHMAKRAFGDA